MLPWRMAARDAHDRRADAEQRRQLRAAKKAGCFLTDGTHACAGSCLRRRMCWAWSRHSTPAGCDQGSRRRRHRARTHRNSGTAMLRTSCHCAPMVRKHSLADRRHRLDDYASAQTSALPAAQSRLASQGTGDVVRV